MASRSRHSSRSDRDSDSMEAIKPLVVLVLFGTILYGAYSVVQKGPSSPPAEGDAAAFTPPTIDMAAAATPPTVPATTGPIPLAAGMAAPPASPTPVAVAVAPPSSPAATPAAGIASTQATPVPTVPTMPAAPQPSVPSTPMTTAGEAAASAASGTTYLNAQAAPPPVAEAVAAALPAAGTAERPDRFATLSSTPPMSAAVLTPGASADPPPATQSSAAFTTAWADAHDKLAAGRYAEALGALSIWHNDPSLGLEESQRLEDLLGQLAGTVIYSQQDLLLPPHVVAAGETLPTLAMPLGISWQLLGKINGVSNPQDLVPGEHLKVLRGPFDAVVSVSRRRVSLQLGGYYAGSFPVAIGRTFLARVGTSIPVAEVRRGTAPASMPGTITADPSARPAIVLTDGLLIEAAEDPGTTGDPSSSSSLVVSLRDFAELLDILGPGSKVLIRQ